MRLYACERILLALYFIYELSLAILQEPPHTIAFRVAEKKEGFEERSRSTIRERGINRLTNTTSDTMIDSGDHPFL